MKAHKTTQTMKPATAAKKLGIYLPATPAEFQEGVVSREELDAFQADPPDWLRELRLHGPHERSVAAAKLGVSVSGLARGGITEALTTEQIDELKADPPDWLEHEREVLAEFRRETVRAKENSLPKPKPKASAGSASGNGKKRAGTGGRSDSRRGRP